MAFYDNMDALAKRMLGKFGSPVTIEGKPTPADPVTGQGGAEGATRTALGKLVEVDFTAFPETQVQTGDQMFLLEGAAGVTWGETVNGWSIVGIETVTRGDNVTPILYKVLVRG